MDIGTNDDANGRGQGMKREGSSRGKIEDAT